jgi:glycerophosphoryl diester phosphodiesterase
MLENARGFYMHKMATIGFLVLSGLVSPTAWARPCAECPAACAARAAPRAENGITAHRGDSSRFPENSLRAFSAANRAGADWIETDVRTTLDGKLVLAHNATTGAYCSQDVEIAKTTYADLRKLDLAEKFREKHNLTPASCPKHEIVLLEEALDLVLRERQARLSLQPKSDCVDAALALVRQKGALAWVGFNDGSLKKMARVKALAPSVKVFWDRHRSDIAKDIPVARALGFEEIVMNVKQVTPENVARIHAAGFKAGAWTVNSKETMRRLLDMGVDRLYTDCPATMKELLSSRK